MEPIETKKIVELINYCSKKMSFFEYDVVETIRKRKAEVAQPFIAFINNVNSPLETTQRIDYVDSVITVGTDSDN